MSILHRSRTRSLAKRGFLLLLGFAVLLVALPAFAAGQAKWKTTTLRQRSDGESWRVDVTIVLPRAPDVAHVSMKFEFQEKVYYERFLEDGDKQPRTRKVPVTGKRPIIEPQEVSFLDPRRGEIQKGTRFTFKVTREHGFKSGEWVVTIRDGRNGRVIGRPTKIIFGGENEVIDRRSIVMAGERKKKKEEEEKKKKEKGGIAKVAKDDVEKAPEAEEPEAEPSEPEPSEPEEAEEESDEAQTIKEKPGGCGCRMGPSPVSHTWLAAPLLFGLFLQRRRSHKREK